LRNLGDATKRVFQRHAGAVRQVPSPAAAHAAHAARSAYFVANAPGGPERNERRESRERTRQVLRERYEAIHELAARGMNVSAIARALGVHRHTVQKYLPLTAPPERQYTQRRRSILAPYERYLLERWRQQGRTHPRRRRNALALWRELRQRGFAGKYGSVVRLVAHWNRLERAGEPVPALPPGLSPRHATALLLLRSHQRTVAEQCAVDAVRTVHPEVETAMALFDRFAQLIREVRPDFSPTAADPAATRAAREDPLARLAQWLTAAALSGVTEMHAFGIRLRQDLAAVQAALTLPYSQGQTEGHITRLKLLKRQMYGRANFDLLRARFLAAHPT
jgi:DNA-binding CsgD family transcriptional regulator